MGKNSPFGAFFRHLEPPKAGGTGQEWPEGGQKVIKMCIGAVLYPFGCHFSAFRVETENQIFFDFEALLGPFWASGAFKGRGELAKSGQKGVKRS